MNDLTNTLLIFANGVNNIFASKVFLPEIRSIFAYIRQSLRWK